MKNLLLSLLSLSLIASCSTNNNIGVNKLNFSDYSNKNIIWVDGSPRVILDTVAIPDEYGNLDYIIMYR
jgi:hypothetical protein